MEPSNTQRIVVKLDELAEIKAATDITRLDYEAKRVEILKAVQAELDALDIEYKPLMDASAERVAALEVEIRQDVLRHGQSVKGSKLHAVFYHGRTTWDTKSLDKYAGAHPEILEFRKEGEPGVQLRAVKMRDDKD
jgi:hypothetical protein